ncbi:hypothetical protein [Viscerimonas tarda]
MPFHQSASCKDASLFKGLRALIEVANNLAATITDAVGVATCLSGAAITAQGVVTGGDESAASAALVTLQTAIDLASSYLNAKAVASNASTISEGGTGVGQYPTTAKNELSAAIITAQGVGSTAEAITGAINDLTAAVATFLNARNLPQDGKSYSIVHSSGKYLTISGTTVVLADKADTDTENTQRFTFSIDASNPASFNILTANGYLANVTNYYTVDNNKAALGGEDNERIVVTTSKVIYFNLRALSRGATDFLGQDYEGATGVYFNKSQALSNWTLELSDDIWTSIGSTLSADPVVSEKYYSLQGVELPKQPVNGLVIVKRTHQSGKNTVSKVLLNTR